MLKRVTCSSDLEEGNTCQGMFELSDVDIATSRTSAIAYCLFTTVLSCGKYDTGYPGFV